MTRLGVPTAVVLLLLTAFTAVAEADGAPGFDPLQPYRLA